APVEGLSARNFCVPAAERSPPIMFFPWCAMRRPLLGFLGLLQPLGFHGRLQAGAQGLGSIVNLAHHVWELFQLVDRAFPVLEPLLPERLRGPEADRQVG